jgi:ComF family protein
MLYRLREPLRRALHRLPALLPSACALCGMDDTAALCAGCRDQYFAQEKNRCRLCAVPLSTPGDTICGACLSLPPAFDATIAACDYSVPLDEIVLSFKFGHRLALAPMMAEVLCDKAMLHRDHPMPTLLTAVPLGPRRLAERGFNQALELAKPLSRRLGVPLVPRLLVRQRETGAQALLHPDERHKNVRHAFIPAAAVLDSLAGAHVGVVDDVMTTGETLNEIAATLKRFGASRVTNYVFARTLPA